MMIGVAQVMGTKPIFKSRFSSVGLFALAELLAAASCSPCSFTALLHAASANARQRAEQGRAADRAQQVPARQRIARQHRS
jgi:hypothetical protein